jgi:hypothetical protein
MKDTYNGYKNRDTWLVALWLNNHERNYNRFNANIERLLNIDDKNLLKELKTYFYNDNIDFKKVNVKEVRTMLNEHRKELLNER